MENPKNINECIADIQDELLDIPVNMTRVVRNVVITRWTKDEFEVGTWNRDENKMGSEHAAELLADQWIAAMEAQ